MKKLVWTINIFFCLSNLASTDISIDKSIFTKSQNTLVQHKGVGKFDSYLSMVINYTPISSLSNQLVIREKLKLIDRGESHITVITPIEYYNVLKNKVSIQEINHIATN